jgi:APA family basic amino acid/polyamine antiporter
VGLIVLMVGLGFAFGKGSFAGLSDSGTLGLDLASFKTMGLSLMWIMFAYSGWNAAAYIGSEVRDPRRNIPRSLLLGTAVVILLYLALNLYYLFAVPAGQMNGVIAVAGAAVSEQFGAGVGSLLSAMVAFALFSSLSAFIILGPRVYYSMARDGRFFDFAAFVHPRFGVPSRSIILQGIIASVMVLLGSFDQILTYMGFSLGLFPILAVLGVFRLRRRGILRFRMPGFPVAPLVYVTISGAILILAFMERPLESSVAIGMVLLGLPVYAAFGARTKVQGGDDSAA